MGQEWNVMGSLKTMIDGIATFKSVSIGFEADLFQSKKFGGNLPAVFLEYRGNEEIGPQDSSFERYVPFTVMLVIVRKADSAKQNRSAKIETAISDKNLIANAIDANPQLSGQQVTVSPIAATRVLEANVRVPAPFWAVEIDIPVAVWETKAGR